MTSMQKTMKSMKNWKYNWSNQSVVRESFPFIFVHNRQSFYSHRKNNHCVSPLASRVEYLFRKYQKLDEWRLRVLCKIFPKETKFMSVRHRIALQWTTRFDQKRENFTTMYFYGNFHSNLKCNPIMKKKSKIEKNVLKRRKKICVVKQNDFEDIASLHLKKIQDL